MKRTILFVWLGIAAFLLAGCIPVLSNPGSADESSALQSTLQSAIETATQIAVLVNSMPTAAPTGTATMTIAPTQTTPPTETPVPTATNTATQATPTNTVQAATPTTTAFPPRCNRVGSFSNVTVYDGVTKTPGEGFTKTWRLRNGGTCTWDKEYDLVFTGGDQMGGAKIVDLTQSVAPGGTIDVSVNLTAPLSEGLYTGYWMMRSSKGEEFGYGSDASSAFWVRINVGGSASFAVLHASSSAGAASYSGDCPQTVTFNSTITTNGEGIVTYYWERSDGTKSAVNSLTFDEAGSKSVSDSWSVGAAGQSFTVSDRIYIDAPNHQLFPAASANVSCAAAPAEEEEPGDPPDAGSGS